MSEMVVDLKHAAETNKTTVNDKKKDQRGFSLVLSLRRSRLGVDMSATAHAPAAGIDNSFHKRGSATHDNRHI